MRLSADDHERIRAAIAKAEAATSGEIFCVVASRVSSYRDVTLMWAACAALVAPVALLALGFDASSLPGLGEGWSAGHLSSGRSDDVALVGSVVVVQALVFGLVAGLGVLPAVARILTPPGVRRARVRRAAVNQMLAHGIDKTRARTGVLLFAAMDDHQAEIVADDGIHARVDQETWAEAADALLDGMKARRPADGFVRAVGLCGAVLSREFPVDEDNPDELPNRLVEI